MSDVLYERYKDALRRGHTASLRGRVRRRHRRLRAKPPRSPRTGRCHRRVWPGCWHGPGASARPSRRTTSRSRARPRTKRRSAAVPRCSPSRVSGRQPPKRSIGSPRPRSRGPPARGHRCRSPGPRAGRVARSAAGRGGARRTPPGGRHRSASEALGRAMGTLERPVPPVWPLPLGRTAVPSPSPSRSVIRGGRSCPRPPS